MKIIYLRVDDDVHEQLMRLATADGRSLNSYILRQLTVGPAMELSAGVVMERRAVNPSNTSDGIYKTCKLGHSYRGDKCLQKGH